jgi:hypothetical protein
MTVPGRVSGHRRDGSPARVRAGDRHGGRPPGPTGLTPRTSVYGLGRPSFLTTLLPGWHAARVPGAPVSGGDRPLLTFVPGLLRKDQEIHSWPITARCGQRGGLWPRSSSSRAASSSGSSRTSSDGRHSSQNTVLPPIVRLVSAGLSLWQHEQRKISPHSTATTTSCTSATVRRGPSFTHRNPRHGVSRSAHDALI